MKEIIYLNYLIIFILFLKVEKFTVNVELESAVAECSGELFIPCDTPEPPKTSIFLRGVSTLFAGGSQRDVVDLNAICKYLKKRDTS